MHTEPSRDRFDGCDQELAEIRHEFNSSRAGGWGIVYDRRTQRWTAVRSMEGRIRIVHAGCADELRERIIAGQWALDAGRDRS